MLMNLDSKHRNINGLNRIYFMVCNVRNANFDNSISLEAHGQKKIYRIILGLLFALLLSFFLYHISLGIIFRDGMGPG